MNRYLSPWIVFALTAACCFGCGKDNATPTVDRATEAAKDDDRVPESWIPKPKTEWPQIVLTNQAEFHGHSALQGASGFLIRTDDDRVLAATAAHLLGSAGGVEPPIPIDQLTQKIQSWRMFPRTMPAAFVEVNSVGVQGLGRENLDWLILSIKAAEQLPSHPLRLREEPVRIGETVYLIGCPYSQEDCTQNVYRGVVMERAFGDLFRYDLDPPVDIRGFSGAPIIDEKGYVVGVMMVWFDPKMAGDNFLEAGGQDIASVYDLLHSAN
ncbi:MAG: serine protease [Pirellulales bacterium]